MSRIRVSIVPYLNAKPFLYGIEHSPIRSDIDLRLEEPAVGARSLLTAEVDLSLAPVALIPQLDKHFIITEYCIACEGAVGSVGVCSNRELKDLARIYLDPSSITSNALLRILLAEHWKLPVQLESHSENIRELDPDSGMLVIGSRALQIRNNFRYFYDLGEAWYQHTQLPFVFAVWVTTVRLSAEFVSEFSSALQAGVTAVPDIIKKESLEGVDVSSYLTKQIHFRLDTQKRRGMQLFLEKLG